MSDSERNPASGELGDICIESVSDEGEIVIRGPGGTHFRVLAPPGLAHYYRRLVKRPGAGGKEGTRKSASVGRK